MILNMTITGTSSTKSIMIISIDSGSTVAVYSDAACTTKVKDAVEKSSGEFWITNLNNGTYYIKATKNSDEAIIPYTISEYGVYRISMSYWAAYINVTFSTDALSLICSDGVTTISASGDLSSGTYTFIVNNTGTWMVTASNGRNSISDSVTVDAQTTYSLTLSSLVPTAYQEVEYLQSSGTQYINVGLNPTSSLWGFEIDFIPLDATSTSTGHSIFGQKPADSNEWHLTVWYDTSNYNGTLIMKSGKYAAKMTQNTRCQMSMHNLEFINAEGTKQTVSNVSVGNLPLYIFCCNKNGATNEFSSTKLYSFKLYDDTDTLVSELYPCYRVSDSAAGLWDKKRKIFLTNQGSGIFVVGADVGLTNTQPSSFNDTVPEEYQAVEYLQSSGTQYIVTSIPANTANSGTIDFMSTSLKQWTYIYGASSTTSSADPGGFGFSTAFGDSTPYKYGWVHDSQYNSTSSISVNADTNVRHTAGFHYLSNNIEYMFDGEIMTKSYTEETYTITTNSITLFAMNYNGAVYNDMKVNARVYSFKLYNSNGDKILDCRPCYRKSDSVAGMWDSVSKTFLTNQGSGSFTVGADV